MTQSASLWGDDAPDAPDRANRLNVKKYEVFFEALSRGATVTAALEASCLTRTATYQRRKDDPDFAERWIACENAGVDLMLQEAQRRAVMGTLKPVFAKGTQAKDHEGKPAFIREYSDVLLMFLLKAKDPLRYCDKLRTAAKMREWANDAGAGVTIIFDGADTRLVAPVAAAP